MLFVLDKYQVIRTCRLHAGDAAHRDKAVADQAGANGLGNLL
jgi:hypothetical protein